MDRSTRTTNTAAKTRADKAGAPRDPVDPMSFRNTVYVMSRMSEGLTLSVEKKQNEARRLRRMLNLFSNPARKAELFAMRACCNVCNQAAEDLGLTREVLAYYRQKITLPRVGRRRIAGAV